PGRTRRAERRAEKHCGLPTLSPVPSASRRAARRPRPCPPSNPRRRTTRPTGDTTDRPEWLCPSLNRGGGLSSLPALLPPPQSEPPPSAPQQCHSPPSPALRVPRQGAPGPVRRVSPGGGRPDRPVNRPTDRGGFVPPSTGGGDSPPSQLYSLPPRVSALPGLPNSATAPSGTSSSYSKQEQIPSSPSPTGPHVPDHPARRHRSEQPGTRNRTTRALDHRHR